MRINIIDSEYLLFLSSFIFDLRWAIYTEDLMEINSLWLSNNIDSLWVFIYFSLLLVFDIILGFLILFMYYHLINVKKTQRMAVQCVNRGVTHQYRNIPQQWYKLKYVVSLHWTCWRSWRPRERSRWRWHRCGHCTAFSICVSEILSINRQPLLHMDGINYIAYKCLSFVGK